MRAKVTTAVAENLNERKIWYHAGFSLVNFLYFQGKSMLL